MCAHNLLVKNAAPTTADRMYRVLGTTEDAPTAGCQHCGRQDLKTYVALEPTEGGPVVYFGTTCAARAERLPVAVIRSEATAADKAAHEVKVAAQHEAHRAHMAAYQDWLVDNYGTADLDELRRQGHVPFKLHNLFAAG